jgi:hypothetical protein
MRALALADAVCLQGAQTWLVPAGWFVRRDSELLRGADLRGHLPTFPWLFAPLTRWWLRLHPDPRRTVGCCGLNFFGADAPNLLCACGHEVGIGHEDCIGPHWYSLHESVVREDVADDAPPTALAERLARARELVEAPITRVSHDPKGGSVIGGDTYGWHTLLHLADVNLEYGGGIGDPALVIGSPQLPEGARLIVPIPWCQLVRPLVLAEQPWGELALPLEWESRGTDEQRLRARLSRRKRRILLTVWKKRTGWAVTISAKAWKAAWARLRD